MRLMSPGARATPKGPVSAVSPSVFSRRRDTSASLVSYAHWSADCLPLNPCRLPGSGSRHGFNGSHMIFPCRVSDGKQLCAGCVAILQQVSWSRRVPHIMEILGRCIESEDQQQNPAIREGHGYHRTDAGQRSSRYIRRLCGDKMAVT